MKKGIIVGTGVAGTRLHLPAYTREGAEIRAFVDVSATNAKSVAAKNGIAAGYDSIEEAVAKEGVDFVSICTPPGTHYELARRAVEAGCHVLVEKPVASNYNEAVQLRRLAEEKGRLVAVVHNRRFLPGMLKAVEHLRDGLIGRVLHVDRQMHFCPETVRMMEPEHWAHKIPGGRFFEANPHSLYLVLQFIQNMQISKTEIFQRSERWPVYPISGFSTFFRGHNAEGDCASATITMSLDNEKVPCRISGTQIITVHGTRGSMVADHATCLLTDEMGLSRRPSGKELTMELITRIGKRLTKSSPAVGPLNEIHEGAEHAYIIGHFLRQMEGQESESLVGWEEILETQRLNDEMGIAIERCISKSNISV